MAAENRSVCPVARALELFGDRWTLLVVRDLARGKGHFNELTKSPERIATNVLADRLARLVAHGLAEKDASGGYRLTEKGKSLRPVLEAVAAWGLAHIEGTKALLAPTFA